MKISYDHDIAEDGDHFVNLADRAMSRTIQAAIHGAYVVDYLPICEFKYVFFELIPHVVPGTVRYIPSWFPGAKFKRDAIEWRQDSVAMLQEPFNMIKKRMV